MNVLFKLAITLTAAGVILVRIFIPGLTIDTTTMILLALALLPWVSSRIDTLEFPGGLKVKLRRPIKTSSQQTIRGDRKGGKDSSLPEPDDWLIKSVKITPVETLVTFIFTNAILMQLPPLGIKPILLWLNFALLLIATPLFLHFYGGVWKVGQLIVSTVAFVIWAYIIGGPFTFLSWYDPFYAALVLALYTFLVPSIFIR